MNYISKKSQAKGTMRARSLSSVVKTLTTLSCVLLMLIIGNTSMAEGAVAHGADLSGPGFGYIDVRRGIEADASTTSVCTISSGPANPTSLSLSTTETADEVIGSSSTTVVGTLAPTTPVAVPCPQRTVTVTVTHHMGSGAPTIATTTTMTAAGSSSNPAQPPSQSSSASNSPIVPPTVTTTSTITKAFTTGTSTTYVTITVDPPTSSLSSANSTHVPGSGAKTSLANPTTTITVAPSVSGVTLPLGTGSTGTAASAWWHTSRSINDTLTYGAPSTTPTAVALGAAASSRGHGAAGFGYCVAAAVACAALGAF